MSAVGQIPKRATLLTVSLADPCVITTTAAHGYSTHDFIRLTNLNGAMPVPHGADPLNGNKYRIVVTATDTFTIQNPITFKDIDSSNFTAYTSGGNVNLVENDFVFNGEA